MRLTVTALALVAAMVLAERIGRQQRIGAIILILISFAWLTVDQDWELAVIVPVTRSNGLTISDLFGIAGLIRGGWLLVRHSRR